MKSLIIYLSLALGILVIMGQQRPVTKQLPETNPFTPYCDSCNITCKIANLLLKLEFGAISQTTFNQQKSDLVAWEKEFCQVECDEEEGDCNYCPPRRIKAKHEAGQWVVYEEVFEKNDNGACISVSEKKLYQVAAKEFNHPSGYFRIVKTKDDTTKVLPFEVGNKYFDWQHHQFDCEPPPPFKCDNYPDHNEYPERCKLYPAYKEKLKQSNCEICLIIPGKKSDYVYRVCPNGVSKLTGLSARIFQKGFIENYSKAENARQRMRNLLGKLSLVAAYSDDIEIIQTDYSNFRLLVKGTINHRAYQIGVSDKELFVPIESQFLSVPTARELYNHLSSTDNFLMKRLLQEWFTEGEYQSIKDFLPEHWGQTNNPLDVIASKAYFRAFEQERIGQIQQPLSLLISKAGTHLVVKSSGEEVQINPELESIIYFPNPLARSLVLADPQLKVIAKTPVEKKLVFIYQQNLTKLWSWIGEGKQTATQQSVLIDGLANFAYYPQPMQQYISALNSYVSPQEQDWLLDFAARPKQLHLVDFFEHWQESRTILYFDSISSTNGRFQLVQRLSTQDKYVLPPLYFHVVGNDFSNISDYYLDWKRAILKDKWVRDKSSDIHIYVGASGIGGHLGDKVDVHPNDSCSLEGIPLSCVTDILPPIIFKSSDMPDIETLFSGWLSNEWRENWRANPIGLLGRCAS